MVSAFFYIPCTFLGTWLYSQNMHVGPSLQEFSRESRRWLKPNFKTNQNTAHTHTHKTLPFIFNLFPSLIIPLDYYLFFNILQQQKQVCFCSVSYHFSPDSHGEWSRGKTAILCSRQLSLFLLKSNVICEIWEKVLEARSDVLWTRFSQKLYKFPILWLCSFLAFPLQDLMSHPLVESLFLFPNDSKCDLE